MGITNRDEFGNLIWSEDIPTARDEAERVYRDSSSVNIVDRLTFESQIALIDSTRAVAELLNETNTAPGKLPTQGFALLTMSTDQINILVNDVIQFDLDNQPIAPEIVQDNGGGVWEFLGSGQALLRAIIGANGSGNFSRDYAWFVNSVEVGIRGTSLDDGQGIATHLLAISIGDTVEIREVSSDGGANDIMKSITSATIEMFS